VAPVVTRVAATTASATLAEDSVTFRVTALSRAQTVLETMAMMNTTTDKRVVDDVQTLPSLRSVSSWAKALITK
jgi:hypothetical protein